MSGRIFSFCHKAAATTTKKFYIKGLSFHFRYTHAQIFNRLIYILLQTDIACVSVCVKHIIYVNQ